MRPSVRRGPKRVRQMLPKESHLLQLVGPRGRINRLVGLEHSPIRQRRLPRVVGRRTTPRIKILKESVSIAELKVTRRETEQSIVGHGALKACICTVFMK